MCGVISRFDLLYEYNGFVRSFLVFLSRIFNDFRSFFPVFCCFG